jgi:hypothetical protein
MAGLVNELAKVVVGAVRRSAGQASEQASGTVNRIVDRAAARIAESPCTRRSIDWWTAPSIGSWARSPLGSGDDRREDRPPSPKLGSGQGDPDGVHRGRGPRRTRLRPTGPYSAP